MKKFLILAGVILSCISVLNSQNCRLTCLSKVNVSLIPNNCTVTLSPLNFISNPSLTPSASCMAYQLKISYPYGTAKYNPPTKLDKSHQGYTMLYQVLDSVSRNACWGYLTVNKCNPCAIPTPPVADTLIATPMTGPYPAGSMITLTATASDNVSIAKVEFYDGAILLNSDLSAPYSYKVTTFALSKMYQFKAVVYDNCGARDTSNIILITTEPPTCTDGIKNGFETGVDCGGGGCGICLPPPAPAACVTPVLLPSGSLDTVRQSSTSSSYYPASKARDASLYTYSRTNAELRPWWDINLGATYNISSVEIRHRTCYGCNSYLVRYNLFISPTPITTTNINTLKADPLVYEIPYVAASFTVNGANFLGRYVRIWAEYSSPNSLSLLDVKVKGCQVVAPAAAFNGNLEEKGFVSGIQTAGQGLIPLDGKQIKWAGASEVVGEPKPITLFPNPARDRIYISIPAGYIQADALITDILGRKVMQRPVTEPELDISTLTQGHYLIQLQVDGVMTLHRFIRE